MPPLAPLLSLKDGTFYSVPSSERRSASIAAPKDFAMACDNWLLISRQSYLLLLDPFTGATVILPAPGSVVHDIGGGSDSHEDEDSADGDDDSDKGDDDFKDSDQNIYYIHSFI